VVGLWPRRFGSGGGILLTIRNGLGTCQGRYSRYRAWLLGPTSGGLRVQYASGNHPRKESPRKIDCERGVRDIILQARWAEAMPDGILLR